MENMLFDRQLDTLNNKLGIPAKLISLVGAIALFLISIIVYKAPIVNFAIFFAYIAFYVQLPGLFILRTLKVQFKHLSTTLAIGLFTGWSLVIVQYFLCNAIGNFLLLYVLGPVLSLAYIYAAIKGKNDNPLRNILSLRGVSTAFLIFALLVLAYALLNTQFIYMSPEYADNTYMNADKAYHMSLIISLSHGYPLKSIQVAGNIIHYHIFSELLYAVSMRLFGLAPDFLLMSAGPLMTVYTICLSFYAFFKEYTRRPDRAGVYCLILMLSNIYLARTIHTSIAFKFIIINDNVSGYGVSSVIAFAIIFKYWYKSFEERSKASGIKGLLGDPAMYVVMLAVMLVATGIKGPIGAVAIGAVWGTYVLGLLLKKCPFKYIVPLLGLTIVFLLVYMTVLGSKGGSNSSGQSVIALATVMNVSFWKKPLLSKLLSMGIPKMISLAIIMVVYLMFFWTVYFIPVVIGYIREFVLVITGRKDYDSPRIFIYAAIFVGMVLLMLLNYSGHSQIYFGFIPIFFAPIVAYNFIEDMEDKIISDGGKSFAVRSTKVIVAICAILLVLTSISLAVDYRSDAEVAIKAANQENHHSKYMSMNHDEYLAMKWLRDNTSDDALIASDRYYSVPLSRYSYADRWNSRFFLYGVYSNRYQYIGASGYEIPTSNWVMRADMVENNNMLYEADNPNRGSKAKELGVNYVVVSKRFTNVGSLSNKEYQLCYSNDSVDIYKIV